MGYIADIRKYVGREPILTAGVVLFVFNENKEVLMQLRTDYNAWGFPGGSMELGESFEEVAVRKLKEETNLEIDELELIKVLSGKDTYREYPNGDGKIAHEIKKEDLINKSYLLKENGIKEPLLLEILSKLKENGIVMDIKNFTVNELIDKLKGIIKTR